MKNKWECGLLVNRLDVEVSAKRIGDGIELRVGEVGLRMDEGNGMRGLDGLR